MFFQDWMSLWRTIVVGASAYALLILLLRTSGKRTLSKMNAFDFVVTVALGSTLATILLSKDTSLAQGVTALALLVFLQFLITWLSVRSSAISRLVKSEPRLVYHDGQFLDGALRAERVNRNEVLQAMRSHGIAYESEVAAVVLETDGNFSVLERGSSGSPSTLSNVSGAQPGTRRHSTSQ